MGARSLLVTVVLCGSPLLAACSDDPNVAEPPGSGGGGQGGGTGGALVLPSCNANEAARPDGSCVQVGVERCAEGFVSDDNGGCDPIVPDGVCPAGTMKLLGASDCVDIAPCQGKWGRAPVDSTTQFVDQSYQGMVSDGTEQQPWTTIAAGIAGAADGAVLAIAAGNYGNVVDVNKSIRLWGACPTTVEIGPMGPAAVSVDAPDVEIHDVSVTTSTFGVMTTAASTLIEGVWAHHTGLYGIYLDGTDGADASGTVRRSSVTNVHAIGVAAINADLVVEDVYVHQPLPDSGGNSGRGIRSRPVDRATSITIDGAVVEHAYSSGLHLSGAPPPW